MVVPLLSVCHCSPHLPAFFQGDGASNGCTSSHPPAALRIHRQTASFLLLKNRGRGFKAGQNTLAIVIQSTHPILNKTFPTHPSNNDVGDHLRCTFIPHHSLHCLCYPLACYLVYNLLKCYTRQ